MNLFIEDSISQLDRMNLIFIPLLLFLFIQNATARGPPSLLPGASTLKTIHVNENEPIQLECPVTLTSDLSVQWSKNNEELDPMWSTSNLFIKRLILKIHRAETSDAGLYKCNAVNGFGNVNAQFHVHVQSNGTTTSTDDNRNESNDLVVGDEFDLITGEAPQFVSRDNILPTGPTRVIQPEGTTVQLKCLATGKPTPEIRWKKNGKILSEDEYGLTQTQVLDIKDLRQSDSGNYTCELFNQFGTLNATFVLHVTEQLQFFGDDPQNSTVEKGKSLTLQCRVRTTDQSIKIQWLKKLENQRTFRPEAIVLDSDQYEIVERTNHQHVQYFNGILSKPLGLYRTTTKDAGQYVCLIQNDKISNYRKVFLKILDNENAVLSIVNGNTTFIYAIVFPIGILGSLLFVIFCIRFRHQKREKLRHHQHRGSDTLKSSFRPRQPLIHYNGAMVPSTTSVVSNDPMTNSVDSIPISRQYQQQRFGPTAPSDLASLTSSNLYYTRVQAL